MLLLALEVVTVGVGVRPVGKVGGEVKAALHVVGSCGGAQACTHAHACLWTVSRGPLARKRAPCHATTTALISLLCHCLCQGLKTRTRTHSHASKLVHS